MLNANTGLNDLRIILNCVATIMMVAGVLVVLRIVLKKKIIPDTYTLLLTAIAGFWAIATVFMVTLNTYDYFHVIRPFQAVSSYYK